MFDARKQIEIGEHLKAQAIDRVELSQGEWVQQCGALSRWGSSLRQIEQQSQCGLIVTAGR